jgi:hypothetical protein
MTKREKGWAVVWCLLVFGTIAGCLLKDAWQFLLGVLGVAVICGIGVAAEIMGYDPRPDHEKRAGQQLARLSKAPAGLRGSRDRTQEPPIR